MQQTDQNTAASAAYIKNLSGLHFSRLLECCLDQCLCIGSWNQNIRIDRKGQPHKLCLPEQMLERDPACSLFKQTQTVLCLAVIDPPLPFCDQIRAVNSGDELNQSEGVISRVRHTGFLKHPACFFV